jgi:hypothetical protein
MDIKDTFLKLTDHTYPYGTEFVLKDKLPKNIQEDEFGNYFLKIGESDVMFTSHLDTSCSKMVKVNHVFEGNIIKTDGKSILGADDKAGVTVMLYMIEKGVPGLYYFFIGEEVGCIGSSMASDLDLSNYKKCVSFDRRGYNSIITNQMGGNCCSKEFARELSDRLNYINPTFNFKPDPTGILTDSASFMEKIPECTNISVGYFNEHRLNESQDISFLIKLCQSVVKIDWSSLPVKRNPKRSLGRYIRVSDYVNMDNYPDDIYDLLSTDIKVNIDDEYCLVKLTNKRLKEEKEIIFDWIVRQGYYHYGDIEVIWDGQSCSVVYFGTSEYIGERQDMTYIVPNIGKLSKSDVVLIEKLS